MRPPRLSQRDTPGITLDQTEAQPGTDRYDRSLEGAGDSAGGFLSNRRIPWWLLLPQVTSFLIEAVSIVPACPEVVDWAESGGTDHLRWFDSCLDDQVLPSRPPTFAPEPAVLQAARANDSCL